MYLSYYHFKEKPFQITTDSRFLWLGDKHKEAFATLKYGVMDNKGFLLLTGDVGTGKTTLINALVNSLGEEVIIARIMDPRLNELDFYKLVADAYGFAELPAGKADFTLLFGKFLEKAYLDRKRVLLIIDESQRITDELLDDIRMLSNMEMEHAKLLNIFFIGQVEFNDILLKPENFALRQRMTINYKLEKLSEKEVGAYISHRLRVAGSSLKIFPPDSVRAIWQFSAGAPRLINIICDRALLTGFVEDSLQVGPGVISECSKELQLEPSAPPVSAPPQSPPPAPAHSVTENHNKKQSKYHYLGFIILFLLVMVFMLLAGYFFILIDYDLEQIKNLLARTRLWEFLRSLY